VRCFAKIQLLIEKGPCSDEQGPFSHRRVKTHVREHIFNEYSVPRGGVIDQHVRHRADELAVPDDGRSAHECGQEGTTNFMKKYF
jgi:hypothetical protein